MKKGYKIKKHTLENVLACSLKCKTRLEFRKKFQPEYRYAIKMNILDEICSHMISGNIKWSTESLRLEANKYGSRHAFEKGSRNAYQSARSRGLLDEICQHMKKVPKAPGKSNIISAALKCNGRWEFQKNFNVEYQSAVRLGILDEVCSHMGENKNFSSVEELMLRASKFKTRKEFELGDGGAYHSAHKRGIIEMVCAHMKKSSGSSSQELELISIVREIYPNAKKIRDSKVKINGKPHIKGFEIDIHIPELNLGIEFDGKYHHSFEYMRKDPKRYKWSDEDIHNYHEIKDAWFASKGIKILHVKWEEWIKNKQECIQRCLYFLEAVQIKVV